MASTVSLARSRPPGHGRVAVRRERLARASLGAKLRAPGFYRAAWMMLLGVAFAFGLTWLVRMSTGHTTFHHFIDGEAILTVALIAAPLMFLVGSAGSTTGSTGPRAARRARRTTPATALTRGETTSASTPTTR